MEATSKHGSWSFKIVSCANIISAATKSPISLSLWDRPICSGYYFLVLLKCVNKIYIYIKAYNRVLQFEVMQLLWSHESVTLKLHVELKRDSVRLILFCNLATWRRTAFSTVVWRPMQLCLPCLEGLSPQKVIYIKYFSLCCC